VLLIRDEAQRIAVNIAKLRAAAQNKTALPQDNADRENNPSGQNPTCNS
jgi:hypothetical protein